MKITSILFSLFFTLIIGNNSNFENKLEERGVVKQVVFDGYEGQIYFFTDSNDNIIIIEDINVSKALNNYKLQENKNVGKAFDLKLKQTKKDNIYSEIEVLSINLLKH